MGDHMAAFAFTAGSIQAAVDDRSGAIVPAENFRKPPIGGVPIGRFDAFDPRAQGQRLSEPADDAFRGARALRPAGRAREPAVGRSARQP